MQVADDSVFIAHEYTQNRLDDNAWGGRTSILTHVLNSVPCKYKTRRPNTIPDVTTLKSQGAGECQRHEIRRLIYDYDSGEVNALEIKTRLS